RDVPAVFGKLHPLYGTPAVSIIFFTAIGSMLAIYGSFQWLVITSVVARLANYIVTCLAVPILRVKAQEPPRFLIPLGPVIAVVGILLCIYLFGQAPFQNQKAFGIACVVGALLYLARPRSRTT